MLVVLVSYGWDTPPFTSVVELDSSIKVAKSNRPIVQIILGIACAMQSIPKETIDELLIIEDNQLIRHYKRVDKDF